MNLTATDFDLANARACAAASAAAYTGPPTIRCAATDTEALVIEQPDHVIIAFRGTANLRDFITDAEFFRSLLAVEENGDRCEVHAGFLAAMDGSSAGLSHHLRDLNVGRRQIYVTGHSLGGALAVLYALALKRQKLNVAQVYTFGQPRVGNGAFKRLYDANLGRDTFRVVNEEDIVPRLPHLPSFTDPYRHCGTEVFLPSTGGAALIGPSLPALLYSDALGLYRAWWAGGLPGLLDDCLTDHHVNNYTGRLATL